MSKYCSTCAHLAAFYFQGVSDYRASLAALFVYESVLLHLKCIPSAFLRLVDVPDKTSLPAFRFLCPLFIFLDAASDCIVYIMICILSRQKFVTTVYLDLVESCHVWRDNRIKTVHSFFFFLFGHFASCQSVSIQMTLGMWNKPLCNIMALIGGLRWALLG